MMFGGMVNDAMVAKLKRPTSGVVEQQNLSLGTANMCRCRTSMTVPSTTASTTGTWACASRSCTRCCLLQKPCADLAHVDLLQVVLRAVAAPGNHLQQARR